MSTTAYDASHFQDNYPPGMRFFYWTRARNRILLKALLRHRVPMPYGIAASLVGIRRHARPFALFMLCWGYALSCHVSLPSD